VLAAFVRDKLLPKAAPVPADAPAAATWAAVEAQPTLPTLLRDNAKYKMNYEAAVSAPTPSPRART
jgi:hypothetical protein